MARYDAEAYSVGLAMRLGLPVTAVATIGTALRAAHETGCKAGAEEMRVERDRLRVVVEAARRALCAVSVDAVDGLHAKLIARSGLDAMEALDAATGEEAADE